MTGYILLKGFADILGDSRLKGLGVIEIDTLKNIGASKVYLEGIAVKSIVATAQKRLVRQLWEGVQLTDVIVAEVVG